MEAGGAETICSGEDGEAASSRTKVSESSLEETFAELSLFMEKISPLLEEMKENKMVEKSAIYKAIESLEAEFYRAKMLLRSSGIHSSSPLRQMEDVTQNLGRSLGLLMLAGNEVSTINKEKIEALKQALGNSRFDLISERGSEFFNDMETEDDYEQEIVEEKRFSFSVNDVVFGLNYGDDEEFTRALMELDGLLGDNMIRDDTVDVESVIPILCNRLSLSKTKNRTVMLRILRSFIQRNDEYKERMAEIGFLSVLVKSLARHEEEQREAIRLLSNLSDVPKVVRRLGKIRGCIVMLVSIFHGKDEEAANMAERLLNAMSNNTQYVLNMAEAGYFKPLIQHLKEGSDMSKVLVATALSRMVLNDQCKASLGEHGAIEPLALMFTKGNLEAKLSALNALHNISTLKENIKLLISSEIVLPLLQLLFSVTSILVILREPASAILAMIARYEDVLVKPQIAQQMLSLLNLSSPVIQFHLLSALTSIASHANATRVRKKMKENGAVRLLLPHLVDGNSKIRIAVLNLVYTLSKDDQEDLAQQLGKTHIRIICGIISSSDNDSERAAAAGVLSNLPADDKKVTDIMKYANILPSLLSILSSMLSYSKPSEVWLAESIAAILIRFTVHSDKKLQHFSVNHGVIPALVKLLTIGSVIAKSRAATCLAQLSQNSSSMVKSRKSKWFCAPSSVVGSCEVHEGSCSIKTTFCLIKANVLPHFIQILEGTERQADEAVLSALATLLDDKIWENGTYFIAKHSGTEAIVKVLELGSIKAQEKALWILERMFRVESCRTASAKAVLIGLAQIDYLKLKPEIAKLLAQLELLQDQSSYF